MKKNLIFLSVSIIVSIIVYGCNDYPIDEDGLLITTRSECYVGSFELVGFDHQTVRSKAAVIDTIAQTIDVEVLYGTDLKTLWPQFSLVTDAKLEPKITGFVDFSTTNPREWTVISGNRKVKKTYKVTISVQAIP